MDAWKTDPIIGRGSGFTVPGFSRNHSSPWAFELSYHATLASVGLIGAGLLASWGIWTAIKLARRAPEHTFYGAILAGYITVTLATYVDPYVQKMDGMWMLFIPFGAALFARDRRTPREKDNS